MAALPTPPLVAEPVGAPPAVRPTPRRPLRDNPRLLLVFIGFLLVGLWAMLAVADRTAQFSPDFLSEVVLYALSAADLTILVVFLFILARNVIKVVVERRRALPFARFRAKLVGVLLGMTLIPALLVSLVGSELIRNSANRWFAAPVDDVLASASRIASEYYQEREQVVQTQATLLARRLAPVNLTASDVATIRDFVAPAVTGRAVALVEVYRVSERPTGPEVTPVVDVADPQLPRGYARASADRWAQRAATGSTEPIPPEPLADGGELVRWATVVRSAPDAPPKGVVVVSDYLTSDVARHARRVVNAYEDYQQLRVFKRPLQGVYLSFFLMVTLLILVSATWMGLYLAKRITRPIQLLSAGARQIGAGHLDHRIERETVDEFGQLVDAFNAMASELAVSQRRLERSRVDLEQKNLEVERRRRDIETILERVATGVVSFDREGHVATINTAASKLLGLDASVIGQLSVDVFAREDLQPIRLALAREGERSEGHEVALLRDGRELHLAIATTPLEGEGGLEGSVLVLDDVTPLIRAQKVATWRDVARRLAHEIKNPLTPIQLSADRLRRHFGSSPPATRALVDECATTIATEVDSLKNLVDEFSQFARMPAPSTVPSDLAALVDETLGLYRGLFPRLALERLHDGPLPRVRVDHEQFRRVLVNLVDNAIEALSGPALNGERSNPQGTIRVETRHDAAEGIVRLVVADDGPGLGEADRSKLFMPYYSTKRRGSGLGLAIVRRIVAEHGGHIEVGDNEPKGTRFIIELPC
jgi:two-component system nitrogen regulation sensor histidine kinase NtrY